MMWLIGLIAGLALGGAYGFEWLAPFAVAGLVVGLIADARLRAMEKAVEKRYGDLEAKLRYLYERQPAATGAVAPTATPPMVAEPPSPPPSQPPTQSTTPAPFTAATPIAAPAPQAAAPSSPAIFSASQAAAQAKREATTRQTTDEAPNEPSALSRFLFGGNILAKIGVVLLFFGVASALKLAAEYGVLPIEARLGIASIFGVGLVLLGWLKRHSHAMFGLAMQGGGVGVMYLVAYFALARYQLIGNELAFAVFAVLGVGGMLLAAIQDGRSLAVLGLTGAFLAPVLASSPTGSHVTLFSYFALLNAFIFGVSWFKSWRSLNVAGFLLTFAIGFNWGLKFYQPEHYATTEPFLILFFVIYSVIPLLFALRQSEQSTDDYVDGILIFGTPVICGLLQVELVAPFEYGLAWSCAIAGVYYGVIGLLLRFSRTERKLLTESHFWLSGALLTLAVPYAFGARATVAVWALEGASAVWLAARRERWLPILAGCALQLFAAVYLLMHWDELSRDVLLANDRFVGGALITLAALFSGAAIRRLQAAGTGLLAGALMVWAGLWYLGTGLGEIDRFVAYDHKLAAQLAFLVLSLGLAEWVGRRLAWPVLRSTAMALPLVLVVGACAAVDMKTHPLIDHGGIVWPLAFITHFFVLRWQEEDGLDRWTTLRHLLGWWTLAGLAAWEASWQVRELAPGVPLVHLAPALTWGVVPAALVALALAFERKNWWPAASQRSAYIGFGSGVIALALGAWSLFVNVEYSGAAGGWPYLPLLNPLDFAQAFVLITLIGWAQRQGSLRGLLQAGGYGLIFVWISAIAARCVHHWLEIPFRWSLLFDSVALQASWSLLWTALAITLMIHATRAGGRTQWFSGFALLGVVGLKLLLVDTAHVNTLGRTVSLLGVALLVIAASYFAPTPPREKATTAQ